MFRGKSLRYFSRPSFAANETLSLDEVLLLRHYIDFTSVTLASKHDGPTDSATAQTPRTLSRQAQSKLPVSRDPVEFEPPEPIGVDQRIWQEVIPSLADHSLFLMHGLLACSALHLAYLNPQERPQRIATAAYHHKLALPLFQDAVANINSDNCHAVLAFVHILAICSFAWERNNERLLLVDLDSSEVVSEWLFFLRRGCDFVTSVRGYLEKGPLKSLLCRWTRSTDYGAPQIPLVKRLLDVIPQGIDDGWSERECQIYRDAVTELGNAFICAEKLGDDFGTWDALRGWPVPLSFEYLQLLKQCHPSALIVLANYCHLLQKFEGNWYFEKKAQRLYIQIKQRLDLKWQVYI